MEVPGSASGSGLSPGLQAVAIITPLATVLIAVPIIIIGILKRKELRRLCKFTDNEVGRADEMESLNGSKNFDSIWSRTRNFPNLHLMVMNTFSKEAPLLKLILLLF